MYPLMWCDAKSPSSLRPSSPKPITPVQSWEKHQTNPMWGKFYKISAQCSPESHEKQGKERLRNRSRPEETGRWGDSMQYGTLGGILERKRDVGGNTGELQITSGMWLTVSYQCQFPSLTNVLWWWCKMLRGGGVVGTTGWGVDENSLPELPLSRKSKIKL